MDYQRRGASLVGRKEEERKRGRRVEVQQTVEILWVAGRR